MKLKVKIPSIPIAQPRQRHAAVNGRVRSYLPSDHPVQDFKATVRMAVADKYHRGLGAHPVEGPLSVSIEFVLPRTRAKIWKTKPMPSEPHAKKPDIDNLAKAVLDAVNGLLWRDDAQVSSLRVVKRIAAGDEQPHVVLTVDSDRTLTEILDGLGEAY